MTMPLERDLQCHCFSHGVRTVIDIQLAQDFLHMVFYGKRADIERLRNFLIVLAGLNMAQDFGFAISNEFPVFPRNSPVLPMPFMEQHPH